MGPTNVGTQLRAAYPGLARVLSDSWLETQAALSPPKRSLFYEWLQPDSPDGRSPFMDDLHRCVTELGRIPGMTDRLDRLHGPLPEFWSALCEIKMAAALVRAGIPVTLHRDTPDLRAYPQGTAVGIELTAGFPTLRCNDLVAALTAAWSVPGRLVLVCPDETELFLTMERDRLVDRVSSARYDDLSTPAVPDEDRFSDGGYMYRGVGFAGDERRIPSADIVEPSRLEVFTSPAPVPVVVTRSGARWGYEDVWPTIVEAAIAKARKLPTSHPSIVAFEAGYLHPSAHLWARLVTEGHVTVDLQLPRHLTGVVCYWQDARRTLPSLAFFVPNADFAGTTDGVTLVLGALGLALPPTEATGHPNVPSPP